MAAKSGPLDRPVCYNSTPTRATIRAAALHKRPLIPIAIQHKKGPSMTDIELTACSAQVPDASIADAPLGRDHGNQSDAAHLWRRYHPRLIAMAQRHLRMSPQRLADEQDVVASAFRSFFRAVREERVDRDIGDCEL